MKIKDIVKEDEFGKIANVDTTNKKITVQKPDGSKIDVPQTAVMPDPTKPGQATIDQSATAAELKPGEIVNANPTSEGSDDELHGDIVKKVIKHHGKPVGEIGIDPEASPGNGKWYVKHYASGHDTVGFDNAEEAFAELKYIVKHHMEESSDIGGDATDDFIADVEVQPHVPGSYEAEDTIASPATQQPAATPDTDGPGVSFDSAQGFKDAIKASVDTSDPAVAAQLDKLVVAEPDGTVDVDQTMYNMVKVMDTEVIPQLVQFQKDMIVKFTELSKSPEFAQASPADQASVLQSIKDMQASLPKLEQEAAKAHAEFQKNEPMMQQNIKDRKMNQQLKGTQPAPMSESDRELLNKMLNIAGLK